MLHKAIILDMMKAYRDKIIDVTKTVDSTNDNKIKCLQDLILLSLLAISAMEVYLSMNQQPEVNTVKFYPVSMN